MTLQARGRGHWAPSRTRPLHRKHLKRTSLKQYNYFPTQQLDLVKHAVGVYLSSLCSQSILHTSIINYKPFLRRETSCFCPLLQMQRKRDYLCSSAKSVCIVSVLRTTKVKRAHSFQTCVARQAAKMAPSSIQRQKRRRTKELTLESFLSVCCASRSILPSDAFKIMATIELHLREGTVCSA